VAIPTPQLAAGIVMASAILITFGIGFCAALNREIQPTRRRDLTLACASDPKELERRLSAALSKSLRPTMILLACGFAVSVAVTLIALYGSPLPGPGKRIMRGILFGYAYTLPSLPFCTAVCLWSAARACRLRTLIHPATIIVATIVGASALPLLFLWVGVWHYLFGEVAPGIVSGALLLLWVAVTVILSLLALFVPPSWAWNRLAKAYPYSE
jgi:hypothetical protein